MSRAQQTLGGASSQWQFHTWHLCQVPDDAWFLPDRHAALQWLRQFQTDQVGMAVLRSVAHDCGTDALARRTCSDEQVLESLSWLFSRGLLHAHRLAPPATGFRDPSSAAAPAGGEPAARKPSVASRASSPPPRVAEDANMFSGATDAAATAAVLRAAAEDGSPFCEECAKAAAAAGRVA